MNKVFLIIFCDNNQGFFYESPRGFVMVADVRGVPDFFDFFPFEKYFFMRKPISTFVAGNTIDANSLRSNFNSIVSFFPKDY